MRDDQTPPTGIPLDENGKPRFIATAKEYSPILGDGPKLRANCMRFRQLARPCMRPKFVPSATKRASASASRARR